MIDEQLARSWVRAFAPPPAIAPSAFAEAEIILPSSANAIPGPLRLASYQRELVDAIADDEVEIIVLMLSSQVGKSLSVDAQLMHSIACAPGPMLHVSPTGARSEEFVRDRFDPLVGSSPTLRALIGTGQDTRKGSTGGANSLASKSFPGGQLNFASSHKPDELAARAIKYLFLDEVDRFAQSAGIEGCPIQLALKRTKTFEGKGRKIVIVSTPTSRTASRINEYFLRGDQRRFMIACTEKDCGHVGPLMFKNLHWKDGEPETAFLSCDGCGVEINEAKRRELIENGEWQATAKGEPGVRSFHLNELASKFSTMESVANQAEAAKTPLQRQVFHNTALAEVYDAGTEIEITSSELAARAETIAAPYAANIQFITCGVDVQGNRLEASFLAHHADATHTVLNHLKLMGDTSGDAVWQALDVALGEVFPLANGKSLNVMATAVDSGFNADQVTAFVNSQRRKSRQCYAVIQSMTATTIESDMPTRQALGQFQVNDGLQGYTDGGASPEAWLAARGAFYGEAKVQLQPGVISHLAQGDKLKLHRSETPNATYDVFDKSLSREAAKAAGSSAEDLSGDYSQTSFSASRLALELPSRITDRRRMAIVRPFYQTVFGSWLEEKMETGAIKLPDGAPEFWEAKESYCNAIWRGKGKPTSDPLKTAQSDILEITNGLSTLEAKLGERGLDFEEVVAQRKAEKEMLEAAGLPYPVPKEQVGLMDTNASADDEALK